MTRVAVLIVLPLCACFERQADCDALAVVSVVVTVASSDERPLDGLEVRYTSTGQPSRVCEKQAGSWLCGYEIDGEILIEASADCYGEVSETVVVPMGLCHPESQHLRLLMDPVDCTAEEVPGVYVTVANEDGEAIADAEVGYVPADEDWMDYEPCEAWNDGWACAWGRSGDIDLEVTAEGYSPWSGRVTVEEDCCGPLTEQVEVILAQSG
jgi:hypothetical protein